MWCVVRICKETPQGTVSISIVFALSAELTHETRTHDFCCTRLWLRAPGRVAARACVGCVLVVCLLGFAARGFRLGLRCFLVSKLTPGPGAPRSPCVGTAYHLGNGMVNHGASREISPRWLRNRAQRGTGWLPHAAGHSGTHRACPRARVRGYAPQARATSGRPRAPHRLWPVRGVCCAL